MGSYSTAAGDLALGRAVERLRRQRGFPDRDEFALAAGLEPDALSALEAGCYAPTWPQLVHIADTLAIPLFNLAQAAEAEMLRERDIVAPHVPPDDLLSRASAGMADREAHRVPAIVDRAQHAGRELATVADQLAALDSLTPADGARLAAALAFAGQQVQRARERVDQIEAAENGGNR